MSIKNRMGKEIIFFDGAMGSMLQKAGLKTGEQTESMNLTHPGTVINIHEQYLKAGSDVITANTFGAYSGKFDNLEEIIRGALANAKEAIRRTGGKERYAALDLGPTGKLLKPLGDLAFGDAYEIFKTTAILGEKYGADLIIIETMSDIYETRAAVRAAKENTSLPVICTMTFDESGKTLTGGDLLVMVSLLESLGVDALGINCGLGPKQIAGMVDELYEYSSTPILIQPNAGLPKIIDGQTVYDVTEEEFAGYMTKICESGAWLVGGCCGTTPEHIAKMATACRDVKPKPVVNRDLTVVSSYSRAVIIGGEPVVIGERINPTGKKKFKEALRQNNIDYILDEAVAQIDSGAHILDVNVGLPEIDEASFMTLAVEAIQEISNIPLQIDSSDPAVIEAALKVYNGKALVNSVNGKSEVMESIFPLVKKYGAAVVGLALDESGIPDKAEDRIKIAEKIIKTAESYGIDKKDILIDTLTLTAGAQQAECMETVKALGIARDRLGVKTVLGVSNISFGLPERETINAVFFGAALNAGLNACIINPLSEPMMNVLLSYNALSGHDKGCERYIQKFKKAAPVISSASGTASLKELIIKGLKEQVAGATASALSFKEPLDIINEEIVPALDYVGKQYEKGRFFLPQLIVSAEAAKKSFDVLNEKLNKTSISKNVDIILATVFGDIHDIGKNIVKSLIENYGYNVLDLGKDVPIQSIIDAVKDSGCKLIGLSALMTTTVANMEKTISVLKTECPECKVIVGGAVLTPEYAKMIGADHYCKDALNAINLVKELLKL